ncbi:MAG TPA: ATP-binding cassette domain-containing protein [Trebonia sp.]|nr:ATP-binding cassette domain-containing protein [Trebonia sp.]
MNAAFAGAVTLGYGTIFGPALAGRGPLVQAVATLGLALVLFGVIDLLWSTSGGQSRSIALPTDNYGFTAGEVQVNTTQIIALVIGVVITAGTGVFLRYSKLGTAMRAMANDREITATLGVLFPRLRERRGVPARSLSGGEQQMVVLAQALVSQPKYILIDELSLGLAPVIVNRLIPVIRAIAASGIGVLLIEQFATVALGLATSAYVMEGGVIRYAGPAAELRGNPSCCVRRTCCAAARRPPRRRRRRRPLGPLGTHVTQPSASLQPYALVCG